jgi:hypothetical protein
MNTKLSVTKYTDEIQKVVNMWNIFLNIVVIKLLWEKFDYTKGVITNRKSKDRNYNGHNLFWNITFLIVVLYTNVIY